MSDINDIVMLMNSSDHRTIAACFDACVGLSSSSEKLLASNESLIEVFLSHLHQSKFTLKSLSILINLTASDCTFLNQNQFTTIFRIYFNSLREDNDSVSKEVDKLFVLLLSNLSREEIVDSEVIDILCSNIHHLVEKFSNVPSEENECIGIRNKLIKLNKTTILLKSLSSMLTSVRTAQVTLSKRQCSAAIIRNCCFDTENHIALLSGDPGCMDILTSILLPLAGPEELTDEENDKLPIDLQYLPDDKKREGDPTVRLYLLEALNQLLATRKSREYIRSKNTYIILREYHKWEKVPKNIIAIENVVDILIRDEPQCEKRNNGKRDGDNVETDDDNLKDIEIPREYAEQFERGKKELLKTLETEIAEVEKKQL